jgi:hypothetical protein
MLCDYAENDFSILQDEAQEFHCNNAQTTVHLSKMYLRGSRIEELTHACLVMIYDSPAHDTTAVQLFQKQLINFLVLGAVSLGVKRPGREADHSPATSAKVKNTWIYTSTPLYVFMV